jgi:hypothetical protein
VKADYRAAAPILANVALQIGTSRAAEIAEWSNLVKDANIKGE